MRALVIGAMIIMLILPALGATGCCCVPCDLGGLLGATPMTTSPGDYADIPVYPGARRLNEVAIPGIVKTLVEGLSGGKFDVKGYSTGDDPAQVVKFYDQEMPNQGWSGSFSAGGTGTTTGQLGQFQKGENTIAMIMVDKDPDSGATVIIIMRMTVPESR